MVSFFRHSPLIPLNAHVVHFPQARAASTSMNVTLRPGAIGIKFDAHTGQIDNVQPDGQGERTGVALGWFITRINGEPYDWRLLKNCASGDRPYDLTLEAPQACVDNYGSLDYAPRAGDVLFVGASLFAARLPIPLTV